jgi:phage tail tape-measure protein
VKAFCKLLKKGGNMFTIESIKRPLLVIFVTAVMAGVLVGCSGGPLTTREKGAGIGALGGAAAGGLIGAAVGHPGAGAAIGGGLGLGAGALVGDQLQGQEIQNQRQDEQIRRNQAELDLQRREMERLKRQQEY